jgi:hypothetical protein
MVSKFKFGLTPELGALGRAGDGGEQDRAEYKAHDADRGIIDSQAARKLPWGKFSRRMRYVICLFRISVSKVVPAICLECLISSFFNEKRKPLSGTILRW